MFRVCPGHLAGHVVRMEAVNNAHKRVVGEYERTGSVGDQE